MKLSEIRLIWPRLAVALGLRQPEPTRPRKPRATMPRILCPGGCGVMVAYSAHTMLTAPHNCHGGRAAQVHVVSAEART